jgi:hypothetical protein
MLHEVCYNYREAKPCQDLNGTWFNNTCYNSTYFAQYDEFRTFCNSTDNSTLFGNGTDGCYNYTFNEKIEEFKNISKKLVPSTQEYLLYVYFAIGPLVSLKFIDGSYTFVFIFNK